MKKYHFDIHNVINCYNSGKLPKLSNVEDTQYEQTFVSNKYYYNYMCMSGGVVVRVLRRVCT